MADPALGIAALALFGVDGAQSSVQLLDILWALGYVTAGFVGAYIVHRGMRGLGELTARSRFDFDGIIVRVLSRPFAILVALFGILQGLRQIEGLRAWISQWQGIEAALGILAATWIVAGLIREVVEEYGRPLVHSTDTDFDDRLLGIVDLAATIVVWILGIVLALHMLGIVITPVLASMGVVGLAIALAVRAILSNFFGGLVLTADPTIQRGHRVEVGEWQGDVVDIGRYKTTIRTRDNLLVSLPNDQLMRDTVINYNLPASRTRAEMSVSVGYDADIEKAEAILFDIVTGLDGIVEDPTPEVNVVELADSGVVIEVLAWQQGPRGKRHTRDRLYRQTLTRFDEAGIEIPYPHVDVGFRSSPPETADPS
jgi:MscS family membrane protein